ncbi:hypothetical protein CDD83_8984 [Cordyceps sp. RAO-2017]|nr:hypothetical protein CDD83_8984 [Cordyceps sp. RAO-2017]
MDALVATLRPIAPPVARSELRRGPWQWKQKGGLAAHVDTRHHAASMASTRPLLVSGCPPDPAPAVAASKARVAAPSNNAGSEDIKREAACALRAIAASSGYGSKRRTLSGAVFVSEVEAPAVPRERRQKKGGKRRAAVIGARRPTPRAKGPR